MNRDNKVFKLVSLFTGRVALIAFVYFLASLFGFLFTTGQNPLPLIWPQAGVALGVTLLIGFDALPGIMVGSFLVAIATGVPINFSFILAVGNTLAAFLPAYFIFTKNDFSYTLEDMGSIFIFFLLGVLLSSVISATFSILGMSFLRINMGGELSLIWETRWLRDAFGVLLFTPLIIVWFGNPPPKKNNKILIEGLSIFLAALSLVLFLLFGNINRGLAGSLLIFIIPIVFWAAIRLKIHGLVAINFFTSAVVFWGIANKKGVLFSGEVIPNLSLLFSLSTMWVTSLLLCSSITNYQKAQKSLSDLSNHDALTNLYNRLFFETELKRLENGRQYPITIIMADVDKLKDVNDYLGHNIGDQVLKNVADIFTLVFRQEDIVSRMGGDEFIVVLPNTGDQEAKIIIDRMNRQFDTFNAEHPELPIHISMGVSTARKGESLQDHLKIADNLMYEEKEKKKEEERIPFYFQTKKTTNK